MKGCEQGMMARRWHFRRLCGAGPVAGNAAGGPLSPGRLSVRSLEGLIVMVVKKEQAPKTRWEGKGGKEGRVSEPV